MSSLGLEEIGTGAWIKDQVEQSTSLVAYAGLIPSDVELPAIRFHAQATADVMGVSGVRIMTRIDWLVVAVNPGLLLTPLVSIIADIDEALHLQVGETTDVLVMECVRLEPYNQIVPEDTGVQYRHAGGLYRTLSQAK